MDLTPNVVNGLIPVNDNMRNAAYCQKYLNAHPTPNGSLKLLPVAWPITTISMPTGAHPFPQLERAGDVVLLLQETSIRVITPVIGNTPAWTAASAITTYDANNIGSTKAISSGGKAWHVAGKRGMWFATNAQSFVYSIPSTASDKVANAESAEGFVCETVCIGRDGALIMGGLSGSWFSDSNFTELFNLWKSKSPVGLTVSEDTAFGDGWIIAGPPGGGSDDVPYAMMMAILGLPSAAVYQAKWRSMARTAIENGQLTFFPFTHKGKVRRVLPYGEGYMVYTDDAVYRIVRKQDGSFDEEIVLPFGVCGRQAAWGDDKRQAFLTKQGAAYRTVLGEGLNELRGEWFLSTLALDDTVVCSYDSLRRWFWFTDASNGFCVTDLDKWSRTVAIRPISLMRFMEDELIGTYNSASGAVTIKTCPFDGGPALQRKTFGIGDTNLGCKDGGSDLWQVSLDAKLELGDAFTTFAAANYDRRGRKNHNLGGVEFAVEITNADYSTSEVSHLSADVLEGKFSMRPWLDA